MDLGTITNVAIAAASLVAVFAFVVDVYGRRVATRNEAILKWQIVLLQTLFQKRGEPLKFNAVKELFLTHSRQFSAYKLSPKDLSDDGLRSVLIKMVADRILDQAGDDQYVLFTPKAFMTEFLKGVKQFSSVTQNVASGSEPPLGPKTPQAVRAEESFQ